MRRYLVIANRSLEQGDPQQARRAFQAAFGLSAHDDAFNEDARVQLHNITADRASTRYSMGRFIFPHGHPTY